ncbi:hypothetical protein [Rugosimonospora africana]|uniref:Uncharacterized protein n=1 Tax=Rugosimonospora africana TaxID=556532 RepID=A0A8J3VU71_9ACTN|nr:hypothetical protein [Rugosimonospora africana]GIH18431.1 hypothetical protein Raf01_66030 [Rugosimonospora africana]
MRTGSRIALVTCLVLLAAPVLGTGTAAADTGQGHETETLSALPHSLQPPATLSASLRITQNTPYPLLCNTSAVFFIAWEKTSAHADISAREQDPVTGKWKTGSQEDATWGSSGEQVIFGWGNDITLKPGQQLTIHFQFTFGASAPKGSYTVDIVSSGSVVDQPALEVDVESIGENPNIDVGLAAGTGGSPPGSTTRAPTRAAPATGARTSKPSAPLEPVRTPAAATGATTAAATSVQASPPVSTLSTSAVPGVLMGAATARTGSGSPPFAWLAVAVVALACLLVSGLLGSRAVRRRRMPALAMASSISVPASTAVLADTASTAMLADTASAAVLADTASTAVLADSATLAVPALTATLADTAATEVLAGAASTAAAAGTVDDDSDPPDETPRAAGRREGLAGGPAVGAGPGAAVS